MSIVSISAPVTTSAALPQKPRAASNSQPNQAAQAPHHQHHHAGGARGAGTLTPGTLTSAGTTSVLDTLV